MIASPTVIRSMTIGLTVAMGCCWAHATEPEAERARPPLGDTPSFRAPEEPPDGIVEAPVAAEPMAELTLEQALALALMQSPELAVFSWEVRSREARALQAKKIPNLELDLRHYWLEDRGGNGDEDGGADVGRSRVILSQLFELGGKRRRRVDRAQLERDVAEWDYEAKRNEVAATVAGRFVDVLGAQRRVESWSQLVTFCEDMREKIATLIETGSLGQVEHHRVTRRVGLARIELQQAEAALSAARYGLVATWGSRSPQFTRAVGDLETVGRLPDVDTVIDLAQHSPTMGRWEAEVARRKAAIAVAKSRRVPDLNFGVGVRWRDDADARDYLVDLGIELPFVDRKQGDILEARYDAAKAQAGRKAAANATEVSKLYYTLAESDARRRTLQEEVVPATRAAFEAYRKAFETHVEILDDLIDARRDLARTEADYTEALVDYHRALATLEAVVGQPLAQAP